METQDDDAAVSAMEADLLARMDREDRRFWRGCERRIKVLERRASAVDAGWAAFALGLAMAVWGTRFLPADAVTPAGNATSPFLLYWFIATGVVAAGADEVAWRINRNCDRHGLMLRALGLLAFGGLVLSDAGAAATVFQGNMAFLYHGNAAALALLVSAAATWFWFRELADWVRTKSVSGKSGYRFCGSETR